MGYSEYYYELLGCLSSTAAKLSSSGGLQEVVGVHGSGDLHHLLLMTEN